MGQTLADKITHIIENIRLIPNTTTRQHASLRSKHTLAEQQTHS